MNLYRLYFTSVLSDYFFFFFFFFFFFVLNNEILSACNDSVSRKQRPRSDCADAQSDLGLWCLHEPGRNIPRCTLFPFFQCQFEDVLAEPEGTHSIDCVWKLSYTCFNLWKNICYKLATLFYGCCIAAEWGYYFAYTSFVHIWYITPFFKWLDINCGVIKKLWGSCVSCCCEPCCMTCGLIFHQFNKN